MRWVVFVITAVVLFGCDEDEQSKVTPYDRESAMSLIVKDNGDIITAGISTHRATGTRGESLDHTPPPPIPELYVVRTTGTGEILWERFFDLNPVAFYYDPDEQSVVIRGYGNDGIKIGGFRRDESFDTVIYHLYLSSSGDYIRHADIPVTGPEGLQIDHAIHRYIHSGFCFAGHGDGPGSAIIYSTNGDDELVRTIDLPWPKIDDLSVDIDGEIWACSAEAEQVARLSADGDVQFIWDIPDVQAVEPTSSGFAAINYGHNLLRTRVFTAYLENPELLSDNSVPVDYKFEHPKIIELRFGNLIVLGQLFDVNSYQGVFLARVVPTTGEILWSITDHTDGKLIPHFVAPDWDEDFFVAGRQRFSGGKPDENAFLMKVTTNGDIGWTTTFGL